LGEAQVFAPATCQALDVSADRALLRLGDGREVAKLTSRNY
jgi:hypothetical protein